MSQRVEYHKLNSEEEIKAKSTFIRAENATRKSGEDEERVERGRGEGIRKSFLVAAVIKLTRAARIQYSKYKRSP